jgi:xanthine dehydrogenase iron-sulfur cluster and FAD-binding subunit A
MIACKLNLEKDIISDIAISVGSCTAVAKRLKSLESMLIGKSIKDQLNTIIINFNYKNYLSPITDIRGTNSYRLQVSKVLTKNAIIKAVNKFNFEGLNE